LTIFFKDTPNDSLDRYSSVIIDEGLYNDSPLPEAGYNFAIIQLARTLMDGAFGDATEVDIDAPMALWDERMDQDILDSITHPEWHYLPRSQTQRFVDDKADSQRRDDQLDEERAQQIALEMAISEVLNMRELEGSPADRPIKPLEDARIYATYLRIYREVRIASRAAQNYQSREAFFTQLRVDIGTRRTPAVQAIAVMKKWQEIVDRWVRREWGPMAHVRYSRPGKVLSFDKKKRLATVQMSEDVIWQTEDEALLQALRDRLADDQERLHQDTRAYAAAQARFAEAQALVDAAMAAALADAAALQADVVVLNADLASVSTLLTPLDSDLQALIDTNVLTQDAQAMLQNDQHAIRTATDKQQEDLELMRQDQLQPARDAAQAALDKTELATRETAKTDADAALKTAQDALAAAQKVEPPLPREALAALTKNVADAAKSVAAAQARVAEQQATIAEHTAEAARRKQESVQHAQQLAEDNRALAEAMQKLQADLARLVADGALTPAQVADVNATTAAIAAQVQSHTEHVEAMLLHAASLLTNIQQLSTGAQRVEEARETTTLILAVLGQDRERLLVDADALAQATLTVQKLHGIRQVRTGSGRPKIKANYLIHFPYTLTSPPRSLLRGPKEWDLPWLIAPLATRWLYHKELSQAVMERWAWPPPDIGEEWLPEPVRDDLARGDELLGAVTPEGEDTQIVVIHGIPTDERVAGSHGLDYVGSYDVVVQYPGMGFDDPKPSWTPNPPHNRITACANDATTTVGRDWTDIYFTDAGESHTNVSWVLDEEHTCCLPWPFTVIDPHTGEDVTPKGPFCAWSATYKAAVSRDTAPATPGFLPIQINAYRGEGTDLSTGFGTYLNATQQIHQDDAFGVQTFDNSRCAGCHWLWFVIVPIIVGWDACTIETLSVPTDFISRRVTTYLDRAAWPTSMEVAGAWGDKAAYVFNDVKYAHTNPVWWDAWNAIDLRFYLRGDYGAQDVTPPFFHGETSEFEVTLMAPLNDESEPPNMILIGDWRSNEGERRAYRWEQGAWTMLPGVDFVWAMSLDAMDLLASAPDGTQIYSLDSGQTWTPCPKLFNPSHVRRAGAVKFIDDCS
jgi:hypothetical protein